MSAVALTAEPLGDDALTEVMTFVRRANPFAQQTWGWDTGRFVDWRWGSNAAREAAQPGWFATHGTIFRDHVQIRALAIAESGGPDTCILTADADAPAVRTVLERLLACGDPRTFEAAANATWLRPLFLDAGLVEETDTGCEWEYDLERSRPAAAVPGDLTLTSLAEDRAPGVHDAIARCIERAFSSDHDARPALRSIESNPLFRPELSVFVHTAEGNVAAYCRGTVDPVNGVCGIDPVCTDPDYQRLGLGKAIVLRCFEVQRRLGGRRSYIGSAPEPAPGTFLYRSLQPAGVTIVSTWSLPGGRGSAGAQP